MPRRRGYIVHYATARTFAQYAVRVEVSAKERAILEERWWRWLKGETCTISI
jgi:hypothetical protein